MLSFFLLSVSLYLIISVRLAWHLFQQTPPHKSLLAPLALALASHTIVLYPHIVTVYGLNFNLFNSLSLTSLFFGLFFVVFSLYRPILSLGILAVPLACLGVTIGYFGTVSYQPIEIGPLLAVHILLSFAAYCLLLMAAVQGVLIRLQIRELKHKTIHRFWVSRLPALQSMEALLFDMILMGFVILSIALGLGFAATYDVITQHIAHKMAFSVISWLVFGLLIIGHYRYGWRGKRAANFAIYGFVLLAIGFVGSKAVLEMLMS